MDGEAIRNAFNILNKLEDSGFCVYQDALVSLASYKSLLRGGFDRYEPFLIFVFNRNRVECGLVGYFECKDWVEFLYGKVNKYESYAVYSNEPYSLKLIDSLMIIKKESCFVQTSSFGVLIGFPCKFYDEAKKLYCYNKAKEMFSALENNA